MKKRIIALLFLGTIISISGCIKLPDIPVLDKEKITPLQKRTLNSLKKLNNHPFYSMTYHADYRRVESVNSELILDLSKNVSQCTSIVSHGKNPVFGRNHDYTRDPVLILFTKPDKGYASVSFVDMAYIGFKKKDEQDFTEDEKTRLLFAPFAPCDGMNEKGLAIGMMARDDEISLWDILTGKTIVSNKNARKLTSSLMITRKVLDSASTVDEAVALFEKHRIFFFASVPLHYMVSDSRGKSAIIEYINGKLKVIYNKNQWQACSNHQVYMSEKATEKRRKEYWQKNDLNRENEPDSVWRYITANHMLKESKDYFSMGEAMKILKKVSIDVSSLFTHRITDWSVVYELKSRTIHVAIGRDYSKIHKFILK